MADFSLTEWCYICYKYEAFMLIFMLKVVNFKNISICGALIRYHCISKIVESINASEKLAVKEKQE